MTQNLWVMELDKATRECNDVDHEDWTSRLPDEVIGHILSFLPTKRAAATCIVSKRWRHLWTNHITTLWFNNDPMILPPKDTIKFCNFVDRVLQLCGSKAIDKFHLSDGWTSHDKTETWIDKAVNGCDVCTLVLCFVKVPSFVFTSKTLSSLKLDRTKLPDACDNIPVSYHLPNLRIIDIEYSFLPAHVTENLFRCCPLLQDLKMIGRDFGKHSDVIISAPHLKRLVYINSPPKLKKCHGKFIVNAPSLKHVTIYNSLVTDYRIQPVSSMVEAKVSLGVLYDSSSALELLTGLCDVKSLSLRYRAMQISGDACDPLHFPMFHNLTKLRLVNFESVPVGLRILPHLFNACPKLEVLIWRKFKYCYPGPYSVEAPDCSSEPRNWGTHYCLSSCLEVVEFQEFEGSAFELELVEYVFKYALVLKTLTINPDPELEPKTKEQLCKSLLGYPRSSSTYQVYFSGDLIATFISS